MKYYIEDRETSANNIPKYILIPKHILKKWNEQLCDIHWIVKDLAEWYHNHCDGWEDLWPLIFVIVNEDNSIYGKFTVERDYDPIFHVRKMYENE